MFIGAEAFTGIIASYRLVWASGRFGGHKTSLCYRLAVPFLDVGYRLVTNNLSVWSDDPEKVQLLPSGHLKAVIILDEGGLEFKSNRQIEAIAAYANKMDCIYLIPSFFPPARVMQLLTVQPLFSLKATGLPVIVYRWRVKIGGFEDKGNFLWINPAEIYGIYSRQDPGARSENIVNWLIRRTDEYRKRFHADTISSVALELTEEDKIIDALEGFQEAADGLSSLSFGKRSRRRF